MCSALVLSGCSGNDLSDSVSLDTFDVAVDNPVETKPLSMTANAALLVAIKSEAFDTEYGSETIAPHFRAWEHLNMQRYADEGASSRTINCGDIVGDGRGTLTVTSTMQKNYNGYVEHTFDDCVVRQQAFSGTRRIRVLEPPKYAPTSDPALRFRWEYDDYYWGTGGFKFYIDGVVEYEEQVLKGKFTKPYRGTSNYRFATRDGHRHAVRELATQCEAHPYPLGAESTTWRCEVTSGSIVLDGLGEYAVQTKEPVYRSVWKHGAKLDVSDAEGNHLVYWGEDEDKNVTYVDPLFNEKTYAVTYDSDDYSVVADSNVRVQDPSLHFSSEINRQWGTERYSYDTDEFIFFDEADAQYVDAIRYTDGAERRIDLIEPAYSVNVISEGETLVSSHDGSIRNILLEDPLETSNMNPIGLGKILKVHNYNVVTHSDPNYYYGKIVSFKWDNNNQLITQKRGLANGDDVFSYSNGSYVSHSSGSLTFGFEGDRYYENNYLDVGDPEGYLKFFDDNMLLTGNGVVIKCATRCQEGAMHWMSINEAINIKYPLYGDQIVVAAAVDSEGYGTAPGVMVVATKSVADLAPIDANRSPQSADHLWAIDLTNTGTIKKLSTPTDKLSSPLVGFEIRGLNRRHGSHDFVGVGSWKLHSGRDNTVLFDIDVDEIQFN